MHKSIDELSQEYGFKHGWSRRNTMISRTTILYIFYREQSTKNSFLRKIGKKIKRIVSGRR